MFWLWCECSPSSLSIAHNQTPRLNPAFTNFRFLSRFDGIRDGEAFALKKLPALPPPSSSSASSSSGDWVSQFNTLKTLHRNLVKYAMEVLPQPQAKFETPDLHKIAKGQDEVEILAFCRIVVAIR